MADKEKIYPKGYPRQQKSFSKEQKFKFDVFEAIKEIALETTEKAFEEKGYKKQEGRAGEYGTGDSYGAGTSLNHFNIRLSSRPNTNTYFEKIIYFGGKRAISVVSIGWDAKNKTIELTYKTSEFSAFRGYHDKMSYDGAQLVNNRSNFVIDSMEDFEKEMKKMFKSFADKEVAYITSTKVGIEDKTEKSIDSMVESNLPNSLNSIIDFKKEINSMKQYSLKDLMNSSAEDLASQMDNYINEGKKDKEDKIRMNNPEVVAANSPGKLLFDDIDELEEGEYKELVKKKLKKFQAASPKELKPSEKKSFFDELDAEWKSKEETIDEVSASGGNAAGGAYLTPMAFKKGGDLNLEDKFQKTPYAQAQKPKPYVKKTVKEGDSFWSTVELNPGSGYVPKGMEHNYELGAHSKNTSKDYPGKAKTVKEGEEKQDGSLLKESLIKRKFATLKENEEKGVNKRYIVTEQRTKEEEENRWKKLALFETYETIKNAESCGCADVEDSHEVSMEHGQEENEKEFMQRNSDAEVGGEVDGRVVVMVPKPNSLSNAMFKVFEDDYLNEGKAYILDLNSGNLVANPNFKAKK